MDFSTARVRATPQRGGARRRAPATANPSRRALARDRTPATAFSPQQGAADDDRAKDEQISELRAAVKQLHGHLQTVLVTAQSTIDNVVQEQEEQAQEAASLRQTLSSVMAGGANLPSVPANLSNATYSSLMSQSAYADWALDATFRGGLNVAIEPETTTTLQPNGVPGEVPRQKCGVYLSSGSRALVASSTGVAGCFVFRAASGGALLLESDQMTELFPGDILSFVEDPEQGYRVVARKARTANAASPLRAEAEAWQAEQRRAAAATKQPNTPARGGGDGDGGAGAATPLTTWRSVTARDRTELVNKEVEYGLEVARRVLRQLIGRHSRGRAMTADDVFRRMDTSGRNLVTRRQFFKGLSSLHIFLNLRDQGALWRTLDINFDNRLQYTEFALLFSPSELRDSISAIAPPHVADDAGSRFKSPRKELDTASTLREVARQMRSVAYVGGEGSSGGGSISRRSSSACTTTRAIACTT